MRARILRLTVLLGLLVPGARAIADEPGPAILIRVVHPDRQARAMIDWFEGSKAAHPAAALAAWKRASQEPDRLGKPLEALIAAINPRMADELRTLHEATVALGFEPAGGRLEWDATLPEDDGTFAALATAFVLSGGAAEGPMDGLAIDRLGGSPGSPLMVRSPRGLLMSGTREGLKAARKRSETAPLEVPVRPGLEYVLDARALDRARSLAARRVASALKGLECSHVRGTISVRDSGLVASGSLLLDRPVSPTALVDPDWLDWVPADRASAAFALAIDPKLADWDGAFRLADAVERVDATRANLAPLKLRFDLLARTIGVRGDAEVWPHLRGVSGWIGSRARAIDGGFLMLHCDEESAAGRICDRLKPIPGSGPAPEPKPAQGRWLGQVEGRPLRVSRVAKAVIVEWGEGVLEASTRAHREPERSAGRALRRSWGDRPPTCAGGIWPGRVPGLFPEDTALARAVDEAPSISWKGSLVEGKSFDFSADWPDLEALVDRFLDAIPLDPPPDR